MRIVVLLVLLSVIECSSSSRSDDVSDDVRDDVSDDVIVGRAGGGVALPCRYDNKRYGLLSMCWGRGAFPIYGCSDPVIYAKGTRVTQAPGGSTRFQLLGGLDGGDVSLSISNLSLSDAGLYGCRVAIPGFYNDLKRHVTLIITTDPEMTSSLPVTTETSTQQQQTKEAANHTQGSDVTVLKVAQSHHHINSLQIFIGKTLRASFIVFIPAVVLAAIYRFWRTNQRAETDVKMDQSEEEEEEEEERYV